MRLGFRLREGVVPSPDQLNELRLIGSALIQVGAENIEEIFAPTDLSSAGAGTVRLGNASAELAAKFDASLQASSSPGQHGEDDDA